MSVRVLGLDISTCTGYALWDYSRDVSSIEADVIELPEAGDYDDDWRVAQMGPKTVNLIKKVRPDLVLVEERLRFSKAGTHAFAMSNALHGAVYGVCCTMNVLFGTIGVRSWHAAAYGEGFKQPLVPDCDRTGRQKTDAKTGKPLFKLKDWKDIAVEKCQELQIPLPSKKSTAHNAAEAAIVAMMWRCHNRITIPAARDHDRYIELLQRPKTPKAVAA